MNDTTATVRAEILEDGKCTIDEQINNALELREVCKYMSDAWNFWDAEIDRLLIEKDNLSWGGELCNELSADYAADYAERAELYEIAAGR